MVLPIMFRIKLPAVIDITQLGLSGGMIYFPDAEA